MSDPSVRFLETDGTTVILDLTVEAGYLVQRVTMPQRQWRRALVEAEDVEGDVEVQSVLAAGVFEIELLIQGADSDEIETRRLALIDAAESRVFLLEVTANGVLRTWSGRRADSSSDGDSDDWAKAGACPALLQVPVQPRPLEPVS